MTLIARLRIILNDVEPMPMRHIEVPLKIRLDRLHVVIQAAMGWTDTHLYEFRVGDAGWGEPDPDGIYDGPMDAKKMTLGKLLDRTATRTIQYVYDFGDDWDHSIRIERVPCASRNRTSWVPLDWTCAMTLAMVVPPSSASRSTRAADQEAGPEVLGQAVEMEWLPPSPNGIAMCQGRGVESHAKRRTAR